MHVPVKLNMICMHAHHDLFKVCVKLRNASLHVKINKGGKFSGKLSTLCLLYTFKSQLS